MPSDMEFRHMILGTICSGDRAFKQLRCKPFRKRRKVFEIYATSIDYDPSAEVSIQFFKQVQNKMHWVAPAAVKACTGILQRLIAKIFSYCQAGQLYDKCD